MILRSYNPDAIGKGEIVMGNFSFDPNEDDKTNEVLPNGHTRGEYYDQGYSDYDIEFCGLDLPGAPSPVAAGWILMDFLDGDIDGEIDF